MCSCFKALLLPPVRSCVIDVSAQCSEPTGKGLLASVLGRWKESHKWGCVWARYWQTGRNVCEEIERGCVRREQWSCAKAGRDMGNVMLPLCAWWLGRWEMRSNKRQWLTLQSEQCHCACAPGDTWVSSGFSRQDLFSARFWMSCSGCTLYQQIPVRVSFLSTLSQCRAF